MATGVLSLCPLLLFPRDGAHRYSLCVFVYAGIIRARARATAPGKDRARAIRFAGEKFAGK